MEKNKCGILVENEEKSFANAFSEVKKLNYKTQEIKNYVKSNYDWSIIVNKFLNSIQNK